MTGSDVRVHLTYQNLPDLPAFMSEAVTKSLGRSRDEASLVPGIVLLGIVSQYHVHASRVYSVVIATMCHRTQPAFYSPQIA